MYLPVPSLVNQSKKDSPGPKRQEQQAVVVPSLGGAGTVDVGQRGSLGTALALSIHMPTWQFVAKARAKVRTLWGQSKENMACWMWAA